MDDGSVHHEEAEHWYQKLVFVLFPSSILAGLLALVVVLLTFWEGIRIRYLTQNLLPQEIKSGETSEYFFTYIPEEIFNTLFTVIFWGFMATIGIFVFWVLANTYISVYNMLVVASEFENKKSSYLKDVVVVMVQKAGAAIASIVAVTLILRMAIPAILEQYGAYLLTNDITAQSVLLSIVWFIVLLLAFESIWLIAKYAMRYLRHAA